MSRRSETPLQDLGAAVADLQRAFGELLLPAFEAFAEAIVRAGDAWHDSRPVRWLNRRARRAAMRRHPAGQLGIVTVQLQLDTAPLLHALDVAAPVRASQPDAGRFSTSPAIVTPAGIRLAYPNVAADVERVQQLFERARAAAGADPFRPVAADLQRGPAHDR